MENIERLVKILKEKGYHLVTAESATCGLIASEFGNISGVSKVYSGGVVVYTSDAKQKLLNINSQLINKYGTISHEIANEMVISITNILNCECGISVTGNAGPTAIENKPVGLFYIGLKVNEYITVKKIQLDEMLSRNMMRANVANIAIQEMSNILENN